MAESQAPDNSPGAGDTTFHGHANFVVIDTPTPYTTENSEGATVPTHQPSSPAIELPPVSDTPVRVWKLKPTRWAAGLIGPLREVKFEGEKNQALFVEFDSGLFSDSVSVVRDPSNNVKPFKIVDNERIWSEGDVRVYDKQNTEIGRIEPLGCSCQGLSTITLPNGATYYMKSFTGTLVNYAAQTRFVTIFARNFKPLIHWSQNSGIVSIYTHLDVTLMLLILARQTTTSTKCTNRISEPTLDQLEFVSLHLEHPNHNNWKTKGKRNAIDHICGNQTKFDWSTPLPPIF